MDFERKALEFAKTNPRGGYDIMKATVLFDNECRLDLGCGGNRFNNYALFCILTPNITH